MESFSDVVYFDKMSVFLADQGSKESSSESALNLLLVSYQKRKMRVYHHLSISFLWFDSLCPINNLSVKQEWVFLG